MPWKTTIEHARQDAREGKRPTTQAGEFVKEEMEHIRRGKHGARNTKQAIAIGLSKARRAGVDLPPPKEGRTSKRTRRAAQLAHEEGQGRRKPRSPSRKRARATERALKREGHSAASHSALAKHAKASAADRRRRGGVSEGVGKPGTARTRKRRASSTRSTRKASATRTRRRTTKRATTRRRRASTA
jgi:Family of unknown function (DUF6496)